MKKSNDMVFTDTLLRMYDYIIEYYNESKLPSFLKKLSIKFTTNRVINTYKSSLEKIELNYPVMNDFSRFYLNTIDKVNSAFVYEKLHKGFRKVVANPKFARFTLKKVKVTYDIVFRDDGEIEIKQYDKDDTNLIFINNGRIEDKDIENIIKDEVIMYIEYFFRTYCF